MQKPLRIGPRLVRVAVPFGLVLVAASLVLATRNLETYLQSPYPLAPLAPIDRHGARATLLPAKASPPVGQARVPVELTLRRGETATQLFHRLGLAAAEARAAASALAERADLRALAPGNTGSACFNPDSSLAALDLTLASGRTPGGRFEMIRDGAGWKTDWHPFQRSTELRVVRGTLGGTLDASIRQAGGPGELAWRMADVLRWDLDFAHDLRGGDRFEAVYQDVRTDGRHQAIGDVVALLYDNHGRRHEAFRFGASNVYYDGEGRPLQKMFLRSPLRWSHVTSAFSSSRLHPVLGCFRPHLGVDYQAPVGTPVQVTANGVVLFAGWDGGGGNVVKVQHGRDYVTAYLHLSRHAAGIRPGARVRQGDVIAYTGATGLATGPHLDYRVKYRGQWVDPQALQGVRDEPLPQVQLASFRAWRDSLRAGLATGVLARLEPPAPVAERVQLAGLASGAARHVFTPRSRAQSAAAGAAAR